MPIKILGVFGKHGTNEIADYAVQNIVHFLTERLELYYSMGDVDDTGIWNAIETGIWNAIKLAFVDLNNSYPHKSGASSACVALIINNDLWVASLGNFRAILTSREGVDIQLSEDARPGDPVYRRSIENRGGFVALDGPSSDRYLVNGVLETARALGAYHLRGAVSSRPKITKYPLAQFSGCLVLVSRGVADVFITGKIGDITRAALSENDPDVNIADRIVKASLEAGATDHVSASVALLGDAIPKESSEKQEGKQKRKAMEMEMEMEMESNLPVAPTKKAKPAQSSKMQDSP